eukprot:12894438-Prorocentrum_lima.AAC.1
MLHCQTSQVANVNNHCVNINESNEQRHVFTAFETWSATFGPMAHLQFEEISPKIHKQICQSDQKE